MASEANGKTFDERLDKLLELTERNSQHIFGLSGNMESLSGKMASLTERVDGLVLTAQLHEKQSEKHERFLRAIARGVAHAMKQFEVE